MRRNQRWEMGNEKWENPSSHISYPTSMLRLIISKMLYTERENLLL